MKLYQTPTRPCGGHWSFSGRQTEPLSPQGARVLRSQIPGARMENDRYIVGAESGSGETSKTWEKLGRGGRESWGKAFQTVGGQEVMASFPPSAARSHWKDFEPGGMWSNLLFQTLPWPPGGRRRWEAGEEAGGVEGNGGERLRCSGTWPVLTRPYAFSCVPWYIQSRQPGSWPLFPPRPWKREVGAALPWEAGMWGETHFPSAFLGSPS